MEILLPIITAVTIESDTRSFIKEKCKYYLKITLQS